MDFFLSNSRYFLYLIFACIISLFFSACATQIKPPITQSPASSVAQQQHLAQLNAIKNFSLKGRLGVVTQKQGFSGSIDWQHRSDTDDIEVYSPLGGKMANIAKTAANVTLTTQDGKTITDTNAENLTETALGFKLPLAGLSDWVLGKPTTSKIYANTWDDEGRLLTLKQDGWDIGYENYTDNNGIFLPGKVTLKSERVNLKLLIEKWTHVE